MPVINEHALKCSSPFFQTVHCACCGMWVKPSNQRHFESRSTNPFYVDIFVIRCRWMFASKFLCQECRSHFLSPHCGIYKKYFVGCVIFILLDVSAVASVLRNFYDILIQGAWRVWENVGHALRSKYAHILLPQSYAHNDKRTHTYTDTNCGICLHG